MSPLLAVLTVAFSPTSPAVPAIEDPRAVEVDGDGIVDPFEVSGGSGSQFAGETLTLHLTKRKTAIVVDVVGWFGSMVEVVPIPPLLLRADHRAARDRVEQLLFGVVTTSVDPGLRWLVDHPDALDAQATTPLAFVNGEKPEFRASVVRAEGRAFRRFLARQHLDSEQNVTAAWVVYRGFHHAAYHRRLGPRAPSDTEQKSAETHVATDPLTGRALWATCHGLYVVDAKEKRWAWAWITKSNNFKMRFCSVGNTPDQTAARVRVPFLLPMRDSNQAPQFLDASFSRTARFVPAAPAPDLE
jgi:hypothetical protein